MYIILQNTGTYRGKEEHCEKVLQMGKKCYGRRNFLFHVISPFPTEFPIDLFCRHVKTQVYLRKGLLHRYSLLRINNTVFENIVGKGEIASNEQFLLFPQCFLLNQIIVSPFVHTFDIMSSFAAELEEPKVGISS